MTRVLRILFLNIAAALWLAACTPTIDQRGNMPTAEKIAEIRPGITSKASVTELLGTPSSVSTFDPNTWYYIGERTSRLAFYRPEVLDQKVVAVTFDAHGIVKNVDVHGKDEAHDITPVARATPAQGHELSFFEQLFGNIGRFNTTDRRGPISAPAPY